MNVKASSYGFQVELLMPSETNGDSGMYTGGARRDLKPCVGQLLRSPSPVMLPVSLSKRDTAA